MHAKRIADYETVVRLDMDQLSVTPGALPLVLRLGIWDASKNVQNYYTEIVPKPFI